MISWVKRDGHHLLRAYFWLAMVPVCFHFGWHTSVFVVFLYSTYANFASDLGVYKNEVARREARS